MCGIAGFAGIDEPGTTSLARLKRMCDAIVHRGPDDEGTLVKNGVALGMRRLSIIDVTGGKQPIFNETESVAVVFNGEIYNHRELREDLIRRGHTFRTRSDTEVLVHLYEEFGAAMLPKLNGMFAFALWDAESEVLLVARDRTGMKPLSYLVTGQSIVFCSELRSLWAYQPGSMMVDEGSILDYLAFGYVPDPRSVFRGVRKLRPGHYLTWSKRSGVREQCYWLVPAPQPCSSSSEELVEDLRARLDRAVARHLESEVPLGAFLSGGLDSSTVVALMARHATGRVKTFSIGFTEKAFDESHVAKQVAADLGTDHTEFIVKPDVEGLLDLVAGMFDEPFADSSAIPTFLVSQLARRNVTVALSGDGGDELFGGYTRYQKALARKGRESFRLARFGAAIGQRLPHFVPARNRLIDLGRSRWGRYAASVLDPLLPEEGGIARRELIHQLGRSSLADLLLPHVPSGDQFDFAAAMMAVDMTSYLPGDILTKVDRTSMAVSLEARVPLLDNEVVDFALSLPGSYRVSPSATKLLFRKAIRGIVPDYVLARPKQGFAIPLGAWFRGPLRQRLRALESLSAALQPYVESSAVRRVLTEHLIGRRDHGAVIWRLMVLESWLEHMKSQGLARRPQLPGLPAVA
jgi:asparagine synthase (glutamine-hydrolysing)